MRWVVTASVFGLVLVATVATAQTTCEQVCACLDADDDGLADDRVCCLPPPGGDVPVVGDLVENQEACGCAETPAGLIAGRVSEGNLVMGCANIGGEVVATIDVSEGAVNVSPAMETDCAGVAAAACLTGTEGCASVTVDAPACEVAN